jgi:dTMP kinase
MNSQGILISFEGLEGAGKSTQALKLQERLQQLGKTVTVLREPGGTPICEQIREVVLSPKNVGIGETTEVLLFQAARAELYSAIVLPTLEQGNVVLMDRTRDSSVVYQGMVRGMGVEFIEQLNDISTKKTFPALTFLLDVTVDTGLGRRKASGKMDRIDSESLEFHEKSRKAYLDIAAKNDHNRWVIIDAEASIDEVHQKIWTAVSAKLGLV